MGEGDPFQSQWNHLEGVTSYCLRSKTVPTVLDWATLCHSYWPCCPVMVQENTLAYATVGMIGHHHWGVWL